MGGNQGISGYGGQLYGHSRQEGVVFVKEPQKDQRPRLLQNGLIHYYPEFYCVLKNNLLLNEVKTKLFSNLEETLGKFLLMASLTHRPPLKNHWKVPKSGSSIR